VATTQSSMKKIKIIIGAVLFSTLFITSCGDSSIERDAKKYAELQCKSQKRINEFQLLLQKQNQTQSSGKTDLNAITDQMNEMNKFNEETTKLNAEAALFYKEIESKYTSDSDKQKFSEELLIAMGNCK
jgi:outer membrane murein-binding lipoprotein Lpp